MYLSDGMGIIRYSCMCVSLLHMFKLLPIIFLLFFRNNLIIMGTGTSADISLESARYNVMFGMQEKLSTCATQTVIAQSNLVIKILYSFTVYNIQQIILTVLPYISPKVLGAPLGKITSITSHKRWGGQAFCTAD